MIVGVLLAAGTATRFGSDKLLAELSPGRSVGELACANLRPAVDRLIAVVRPDASELADRLAAVGAEVHAFADAWRGMGASLAYGVAQSPDAEGWLIALADMPLIDCRDALAVAKALRAGVAIAVPLVLGRRGHPVGFARQYFSELAALDGDVGARAILARHGGQVVEIPVSNPVGSLDVDTDDDLEQARQGFSGFRIVE